MRLEKAVALLNDHHGSSAGVMPPQQPQQPSARGRWRQKTVWQMDTGDGWQTVSGKKAKRAAAAAKQQPPSAAAPPTARGKPNVPDPSVRVVLLDSVPAAAGGSSAERHWGGFSAKQWAAWRSGGWAEHAADGHAGGGSGWRRGRGKGKGRAAPAPAGDVPDAGGDGDATERDPVVDARTTALREQLLEARALEAAHAKTADPCPQVAALLAKRSADLRRRLDESKPLQDVYQLHVKVLAQLQNDADRFLQQATEKWAAIAGYVEEAKLLDTKLVSVKTRIAEMQAAAPAKAQAAGIKPPPPKLQAAFDVIKEQMELEVAALPQQGAAADAVRAMATAASEMQLRLTAFNVARLEKAAAQQPDDGMGQTQPPVATTQPVAAVPDAAAEPRLPATAAPVADPTAAAPPAEALSATGQVSTAAPYAGAQASVPNVALPPDAMQAVVRRAREVAARQDGDPQAVATARAALRARIDQSPDISWLQCGIGAVETELSMQARPTAPPTRQRSRSRSGGSAGDDDAPSSIGDEGADDLPPRASATGKGPGGKSGKGDWPASVSARSTPYGA